MNSIGDVFVAVKSDGVTIYSDEGAQVWSGSLGDDRLFRMIEAASVDARVRVDCTIGTRLASELEQRRVWVMRVWRVPGHSSPGPPLPITRSGVASWRCFNCGGLHFQAWSPHCVGCR